LNTKEVYE